MELSLKSFFLPLILLFKILIQFFLFGKYYTWMKLFSILIFKYFLQSQKEGKKKLSTQRHICFVLLNHLKSFKYMFLTFWAFSSNIKEFKEPFNQFSSFFLQLISTNSSPTWKPHSPLMKLPMKPVREAFFHLCSL